LATHVFGPREIFAGKSDPADPDRRRGYDTVIASRPQLQLPRPLRLSAVYQGLLKYGTLIAKPEPRRSTRSHYEKLSSSTRRVLPEPEIGGNMADLITTESQCPRCTTGKLLEPVSIPADTSFVPVMCNSCGSTGRRENHTVIMDSKRGLSWHGIF
jgi:hypothetical protein